MSIALVRRSPARPLAVLAVLVIVLAVLLTGCEKGSSAHCRGVDPHECTFTVDSTDEGFQRSLEANRTHTEMTLSATVSIESGSGTVYVEGADDTPIEYPITADTPVTITDLVVPLKEGRTNQDDNYALFGIASDGELEGFHAEVTFTTRR